MLCIVSGSGNPVSDDNSQDKTMVYDRKMTLSMQLFHIINNTPDTDSMPVSGRNRNSIYKYRNFFYGIFQLEQNVILFL